EKDCLRCGLGVLRRGWRVGSACLGPPARERARVKGIGRRWVHSPVVLGFVVAALGALHPRAVLAAAGESGASTGSTLRRTAPSDDWRLRGAPHRADSVLSPRTTFASTCIGGAHPGAACSSDADCPGKCAGGKVPGEECFGNGGLSCRGACTGFPDFRCQTSDDCPGFPLGKCTA